MAIATSKCKVAAIQYKTFTGKSFVEWGIRTWNLDEQSYNKFTLAIGFIGEAVREKSLIG